MDRDGWNSHTWSSSQDHRAEVEPGKALIQRHCSRCRRDFIEDPATGQRYAAYISVFRLRRLPDSITRQWLAELCPGAPLAYDIEVRSKLITNRIK